MDLWGFLEEHANLSPEKALLRWKGEVQTYAQFVAAALRAADSLRLLGVGEGDKVCLMLSNGPDYLHIWFGLARLGAVKVPINTHLRGEGLAYVIQHSEAKVIIVDQPLLPQVEEAASLCPSMPAVAVVGESGPYPLWHALMRSAAGSAPGVSSAAEEVHAILYTSGTTGPPKGVMLSHRAYLNSARFFAAQMVGATGDDLLYTCLPLFHINAQAHTVLPAIGQNATMAIGERFSASHFWEELRFHGATIFNSLAAMIPMLCKQPPSAADRSHSARLTACAATPRDTWLQFERRFGVRIVEGYGLTETAGFCVCNPLGVGKVGSMGKPMEFVSVRVVDERGEAVPPNASGEVAIRAAEPHLLMEGYFKMVEQTAGAMRGGWFHSGDLGYADDDGYLYFQDRFKQCIRRRGENISSWEVEKAVNAHPKVLESAAVGVPAELGEEEVKICAVLRPGESMEPLELVQWCEERLAYFMVPRYVEFREGMPKTATERVEKYKLKQEGVAGAWDREAAGYRVRRITAG